MISKVREGCRSLEHLAQLRPLPDDVLHLAPTGGTTGLPKLVPKTHNVQLCRAYCWAMAAERGPDDVHLAVGPINHDAPQITNLAFLALFGGRLVFSPSPKPGDILEYLEEEKHRGKAGSTFLDVNDISLK